ncbi:hypothetical protein AKJ53_01295 [candidate division MSBL1 archaeon SCGC-AAA382F02]|uniref:Radical SAM core domain-containing protein n=1 Tax=candidate division MSBL1 archaeon SCGC-AAA382F02 TaxID=1698282 RepID=A0A133VI72_9EURY|nr:hypothetical protein AKJ53_01295 [candidate division MSBL1 archaeon SCGC-AAA382F02]
MWNIRRSTDEDTVKSLERYFSVVKNNLPAKFRICKRVPIEADLDSETNKLWKSHQEGLKKFENLLHKIDEEEVELNEISLADPSLLDLKSEIGRRILESCHFCERRCNVNRNKNNTGVCGVGKTARIASEFIHHGEEPELVPSYTIFFSGCTFKCQFCQNWNISQNPKSGIEYSPNEISSKIEEKKRKNVKNVNWVGGDPTPNLHNVLSSLNKCETNLPSVWNSNMYLSEEGMKLLSGTQDIYLTDFKYGSNECALKYSKVPDYWEIISRNHKKAFSNSEIIIRHLVLPKHVECCTKKILKWIEEELGPHTRVNLMGQYRPAGKASEYSEISRPVSKEEMDRAFQIAEEVGLKNVIG